MLAPTRPFLQWETIETPHFAFHYPREMRAWTTHVAERAESVHDAVVALVGYGPAARVHVVVDDPYNLSNGAAFPAIGSPAIVVWPVPPQPTSEVGNNRNWGEVLAVHEFAHVAHISRPSRNVRERVLWSLAPFNTGPIARRGSRWLWEGYATYVEGKLTGTGRPHGAWRPALLRELALEGKLPAYGQLNTLTGYRGGSYAYLVGSAYLEWLAEQRGDSSLVHLWRRMTARRVRSFDEAFVGVYGDAPADLYGRFAADVTGKALRVRDQIAAAGPAPGELVQRLTWNTGDPAQSPDGKLVALQLRYRDRPGRVVVWHTDSEPESADERRARQRLLARDPQDVPAIRVYPRARKPVATLLARDGRSFQSPRFFADGQRLLLVRNEVTGSGSVRPDLFVWNHKSGALRRVTHGAALRDADPSPDGRTAAAVRCAAGFCDLVRVDLASGAVTVLAAGTPTLTYDRPRWSPDGRSIVCGVQDGSGVWRVALTDASGAMAPRVVDPGDGVNRYSASFTADGGALVAVSEASGVPQLERIELPGGATRPLTRVTGAAYAPATSKANGVVFYLSEHARGLDLYRLNADSAPPLAPMVVDAALAPAAKIAVEPRDTFAVRPPSAPHPYGLGPRRHSYVFGTSTAPEGGFWTVALVGTDPAGRLGYTLQGALDPFGNLGSWRGAALNAELRRFRPLLRGDLFYAIDQPSRQRAGTYAPRALDAAYTGAAGGASLSQDYGARRATYAIGASLGSLRGDSGAAVARRLAYGQLRAAYGRRRDRRFASLTISLDGATGRTGDGAWNRALTAATMGAGAAGIGAHAMVGYGAVSRDAATYERFVVGGVQPPLFDPALLSQRYSLPAAPLGVRAGRELYTYRLSLDAGGPFTPYLTGVSTEGGFAHAFRVIGIESSSAVTSTPIARLPGIRLETGAGYTLDAPFRHKTRGYVTVEFRP